MNSKQQAVLDYIEDKNISNLRFGEVEKESKYGELKSEYFLDVSDKILSKEEKLDKLVPLVVKRTFCSSFLEDVTKDTLPSKNRSVLDIWRHVKFYDPMATIFQVMESFMRTRGNYKSLRCGNIQRIVFIDKWCESKCTNNRYRNDAEEHMDEFGLYLEDWKTITE